MALFDRLFGTKPDEAVDQSVLFEQGEEDVPETSISKHKEQLERLKSEQPEFYEYLMKNDKVCPYFYVVEYEAEKNLH